MELGLFLRRFTAMQYNPKGQSEIKSLPGKSKELAGMML